MARFTTRVQLNGSPAWDDYESLYKALAAKGFSRTITDNQDVVYELPHAEYNREGELTRNQVLDSAMEAATSVWQDVSILVTESNGRSWRNLKKIQQQS